MNMVKHRGIWFSVCVILFSCFLLFGCSSSREYGFEDDLDVILTDIGVKSYKITNVEQTSNEEIKDYLDYAVDVLADGQSKLSVYVFGDFDSLGENKEYLYTWTINGVYGEEKCYYASNAEKYDLSSDLGTWDTSRSRISIYDYKTGEVIEQADEEYVKEYENRIDDYRNQIDSNIGEEDPTLSAGTDVSYEAELVLMQIAEDVAKQVAKNPGTVKFKDWYWGFAREGTNYAVQGTFECSNLLGVTEEHDIQVWCEASSDYSKIQPYAVYLDGEQIA